MCSYIRKQDEIIALLHRTKLDYLSLTETWLNNSVADIEVEIPGYDPLRNDRGNGSSKKGGGGVLAYARKHHTFVHIPEWNLCTEDVEWIWSKLDLPMTRSTYICSVYRPPHGNYDNFEHLLESKLLDLYQNRIPDVVICRDINIDWNSRTSGPHPRNQRSHT